MNAPASPRKAAGGGGAGGSNPLEDKDVKSLLDNVKSVDTAHDFAAWQKSFLNKFLVFLDTDGSKKAKGAYDKFTKANDKLIKVVRQLQTLIDNGSLSKEKITVKGRNAMSELKACLGQLVGQHLKHILPTTARDAKQFGFTKYHMAAVLVQEGFKEYAVQMLCRSLLQFLRLAALNELADVQVLNEIDHYNKAFDVFCGVMESLHMLDPAKVAQELLYADMLEEAKAFAARANELKAEQEPSESSYETIESVHTVSTYENVVQEDDNSSYETIEEVEEPSEYETEEEEVVVSDYVTDSDVSDDKGKKGRDKSAKKKPKNNKKTATKNKGSKGSQKKKDDDSDDDDVAPEKKYKSPWLKLGGNNKKQQRQQQQPKAAKSNNKATPVKKNLNGNKAKQNNAKGKKGASPKNPKNKKKGSKSDPEQAEEDDGDNDNMDDEGSQDEEEQKAQDNSDSDSDDSDDQPQQQQRKKQSNGKNNNQPSGNFYKPNAKNQKKNPVYLKNGGYDPNHKPTPVKKMEWTNKHFYHGSGRDNDWRNVISAYKTKRTERKWGSDDPKGQKKDDDSSSSSPSSSSSSSSSEEEVAKEKKMKRVERTEVRKTQRLVKEHNTRKITRKKEKPPTVVQVKKSKQVVNKRRVKKEKNNK